MKQSTLWLLALLSILTMAATTTLAIAEDDASHLSGSWEVGVTGVDTKDNPARVNEYGTYSSDDNFNFAGSLDLEYVNKQTFFNLESDIKGRHDQQHSLELDLDRAFKFKSDYSVLEHWKDKENLEQIGATMRGDVGGNQPRVGSNLTSNLGADYADLASAQAQYYEEQSNDYLVTRKEWENKADLRLMPNIILHAGLRTETREGMEQSITLSKCNACHVEAEGKNISEETRDLTLGMTGKFGALTIEYEFLNRKFDDDSSIEEYNYLNSGVWRGNPAVKDAEELLYAGVNEYANTPDSDKDSHHIKARYDFAGNTTLSGSFTKADIESKKNGAIDDGTTYLFEGSDTLESEYIGYTGKMSTRIGPVRLAASANVYEIDGPEYTLTFPDRDDITVDPYDTTTEYGSAESREVTELDLDAVYRMARGTTLRLGYGYEKVDRDEEELGETTTNTLKAAINSRLNRELSFRGSYEYQDIDEPFFYENGTGIGQVTGTSVGDGAMVLETADFIPDNPFNTTVYYWNSVYPSRELDTTNRPDTVNELKGSVTWSPTYNLSATVFTRYRTEDNDSVNYSQDTFVPGVSLYYAPNGKMNLTMAYTFNKQETENQMCVGWYHG